MSRQQRERRVAILQLELDLQVQQQRLLDLDSESEQEEPRPPRVWVRPWLTRRGDHGAYNHLMAELEAEDPNEFKRMLRVTPAMFRELVESLTPLLQKQTTDMRETLDVGLRVAVTLKYLCSGESYPELSHLFRISVSSICNIVGETCTAIHSRYAEEVLLCPDEPQKWKDAATKFQQKWQFPHCVGALDGKHIAIKKPDKSGSTYFNYKGYFSILLMAMVDAEYKFQWVNIGAPGSCSDAQIWNRSDLKGLIEEGRIGWPEPEPLPGQEQVCHYFITSDEAFALQTWMMKPYARRGLTPQQRIFNYRLSRARRVVENAFGILATRFHCLLTTMQLKEEKVKKIVLATVCLHNIMRIRYPQDQNREVDVENEEHEVVPGQWRQNQEQLDGIEGMSSQGRQLTAGKRQREQLTDYVNSPAGRVSWQDRMVAM